MKRIGSALLCAAATGAFAFPAISADTYNQAVKKACARDYAEYCWMYEPDSTQMRRCIESNRRGLSYYCISALIAAGEVPSKYLLKK